ncbi:hypothetical protein B0T10DRAFT_519151 [Thelonectria olida]|uniref:Zn(2)-C6 fungal-type domain-containing protein n=1 Tax=Thelonectria olida TaxID=1576542 RepID=A0A9P8VWC8_9HYPO|nr:hypothetical protein B0T10DRAFT_519151 [Thelonectria olida]
MFSLPSQDMNTVTTPPPPRPSGRKGNKKVRTGCITCKVRKVKCDESKPHCLRCVKTGRKCDGYRSPSPRSAATPGRPLSLSPSPGFESTQESRAFDYYRTRSAKILSGAIDASFWGGLVLKLSATEPAVRHAILAVSSLHECVHVKGTTGRELDRSFAFREYGNAIRSLRNWAQREDPSAIPLIVCILFICIEFLADRDAASQMHISQGRMILSRLSDGHSPAIEVVRHSLVPIYARLSLASFLFGNRPATIPAHLKSWSEVPAIFSSIDEARCGLYLLLDEALQFSTQAYQAVYTPGAQLEVLRGEQQRLLSQLSRWHAAFTVLTSMTPQSAASENVQNLLRIYHQASFIWVSTSLQTSELAYDGHLPAFSTIISLASTIIGSLPINGRMEAFSFETELIAPVYWTAAKCRHPLLRRAALKLLMRDQMRNRRENLWHVRETTVIAARIIEKEEADLSSPPPSVPRSSPLDSIYSDEVDMYVLHGQKAVPPKVLTTGPPSLRAPKPSFADPMPGEDILGNGFTPEPSPGGPEEPPSPTTMAVEAMQKLDLTTLKTNSLESPFGIPESKRIKNTVIGLAENGGIWTTFFKEPRAGESEWDIKREFLRC